MVTDAWFRQSPSAGFEKLYYFRHCHGLELGLEVEISPSFWTWGLWRSNQLQIPGPGTLRLWETTSQPAPKLGDSLERLLLDLRKTPGRPFQHHRSPKPGAISCNPRADAHTRGPVSRRLRRCSGVSGPGGWMAAAFSLDTETCCLALIRHTHHS